MCLWVQTPYDSRQLIPNSHHPASHLGISQPIFTYSLTRHGTRWPTKKRLEHIQKLQNVFQVLCSHPCTCQAFISAALRHSVRQHVGHDAQQAHPWTANWTSPFEAKEHLAGLLHPKGTQHYPSLSPQHINRLYAVCMSTASLASTWWQVWQATGNNTPLHNYRHFSGAFVSLLVRVAGR